MTFRTVGRMLDRTTRVGARMARAGAVAGVKEVLPTPPALDEIPEGSVVELPGR